MKIDIRAAIVDGPFPLILSETIGPQELRP